VPTAISPTPGQDGVLTPILISLCNEASAANGSPDHGSGSLGLFE
jgi:hypothetical protein